MSRLDDIGTSDGWRCWLCDEAVDPDMSVNDPRGPSIDARTTKAKAKKKKGGPVAERLAHRACNTGKGAVDPVVPWPEHLFVVDPAPILAAAERLERSPGREILARCPTGPDADQTVSWLVDRFSRLVPEVPVEGEVVEGGGQFLAVVRRDR